VKIIKASTLREDRQSNRSKHQEFLNAASRMKPGDAILVPSTIQKTSAAARCTHHVFRGAFTQRTVNGKLYVVRNALPHEKESPR